jgi:hypothetical protein
MSKKEQKTPEELGSISQREEGRVGKAQKQEGQKGKSSKGRRSEEVKREKVEKKRLIITMFFPNRDSKHENVKRKKNHIYVHVRSFVLSLPIHYLYCITTSRHQGIFLTCPSPGGVGGDPPPAPLCCSSNPLLALSTGAKWTMTNQAHTPLTK